MKTKYFDKDSYIMKGITLSALMLATNSVFAANINLCAGEFIKTMADGSQVKMWGYGLDATGTGPCAATVPGPRIDITNGDSLLVVNLRNTLSFPTSVIVPGLKSTSGSTPVFFTDASGRRRVRSLTTETQPGMTGSYSFAARPGTFMYQSGTHPAVQVQMGLYGAAVENVAANQAYPGVNYDNELLMIYSEVDPAMHAAVAGSADGAISATYGTPAGPTSMIDYKARYYLVNGESFTGATAKLSAGNTGDRTLIRFLNAGLETHAPVLQGSHMDVIAEYGNVYPYAKRQYSLMLAAGETRDAMFIPASDGDFPLYDRRLRLTNNGAAGAGGLMSVLQVAQVAVANPAVANSDLASTSEDTPVVIDVLLNDTNAIATTLAIASPATHGTAVINADSTVTYSPNLNYSGADSFSYTVRNPDGDISTPGSVSVNITAVNDAPVATDDAYNVTVATVTDLDVMANDIDVDGDGLLVSIITPPVSGSASVNVDGTISYTAAAVAGNDSFVYEVSDGTLADTATVNITVADVVNQPPVAVDDYATSQANTGASNNSTTVIVLANDSDADGALEPSTVSVVVPPANGSVVINADGSITYTSRAGYRGADAFAYTVNDNGGATSNVATVRIDVIR